MKITLGKILDVIAILFLIFTVIMILYTTRNVDLSKVLQQQREQEQILQQQSNQQKHDSTLIKKVNIQNKNP
jgi:hypothetical protein